MDSITIEVIRSSTTYIAEEMGIILRNTAYSPNIRDRMDHSCAVLSSSGELIAQAEHIPVHLGSMAVGAINTVEYLEREGVGLEDGDIIILNDPYIAGTHLNDITLLKPVMYNDEIIGFVANKAHHADIGGSVPGSMNSEAKELFQEGIIIPPVKLVKRGKFDKEILGLISSNVRVAKCTIGDLKAQIAALNVGTKRILELVEKYGCEQVSLAWDKSLEYTENFLKSRISQIAECRHSAVDYLELGGKLINVNAVIEIKGGSLRVDFSGTHEQVSAPLNAVYGVTVAATSFALKAVLGPEIPMNFGFFKAVEIYAPKGTIVNPVKPCPVAAGNVETSQRIVDVLLKVLLNIFPDRIPAASHGSMNNVVMGGAHDGHPWVFYETIGGGMGARATKDGVDAVHTNMTNTLNTPIEIIENEYPLLVTDYSLRGDSGGAGKFKGGLGIKRAFKSLSERTMLSITTERVKISPWGLDGGADGALGEHYILKANGKKLLLSGKDTTVLDKGDSIVLNTPGGGGYGNPALREPGLILENVKDGKVSVYSAYKDYMVKIVERDGELVVDFSETAELRETRCSPQGNQDNS